MFNSITILFASTTKGASKKINKSIISLPINPFISNTHRVRKEQRREVEGGADLLVFGSDFNMANVSTEVARTLVPQGSMIGGIGSNSITLLRASPAKKHRAASVCYAASSKSSLESPTSHRETKIYGRALVSVN